MQERNRRQEGNRALIGELLMVKNRASLESFTCRISLFEITLSFIIFFDYNTYMSFQLGLWTMQKHLKM